MDKTRLELVKEHVPFKRRLYFREGTLVDKLGNEAHAEIVAPPALIQVEGYWDTKAGDDHFIYLIVGGILRKQMNAWGHLYARDYESHLKPEILERPELFRRMEKTVGCQDLANSEQIRKYVLDLHATHYNPLSPEAIGLFIKPEARDKLEGYVFLNAADFHSIYPDSHTGDFYHKKKGKIFREIRAVFEAATSNNQDADSFLLGDENVHLGLQSNSKPFYFPVVYLRTTTKN